MKKLLPILLILILICSCHSSTKKGGHTFTDDLGRTVTVQKTSRVATLLGSYADIWMLAGGKVCATADDAWADLNLSLDQNTINIGSSHNPNIENVLSASPDFVIASSKMLKHIELEDSLENAGIIVAYFDVDNFDDYIRVLSILTQITGRNDLFELYGQKQISEIETIISKHKNSQPQTVLVLRRGLFQKVLLMSRTLNSILNQRNLLRRLIQH
jgi:iron complex transport system substrate-binding protein